MKATLFTLTIALAAATATAPAFARDALPQATQQALALKDGSTLYVFKDGKMGMEDKFGRATYMESGHVMETKDGEKIIMNGNEIWRVDKLLHTEHRGGGH